MNDLIVPYLERIAAALEKNTKKKQKNPPKWEDSAIWVWYPANNYLKAVEQSTSLPVEMLVGIERQAEILMQNSLRFAKGYSANNALLWGARGMGKSSLVKAVHSEINKKEKGSLILIEIFREDISSLPSLLDMLRASKDERFILFCDDLSFSEDDADYKSLKVVLEGGVESRPDNVIFYATSNRRHLMPRSMIENERSSAIHPSESTEEKISLSDRFGLWLGFYSCSQDEYFEMVDKYCKSIGIKESKEEIHSQALEWSQTRGGRSGRVAWQFMQHLAGMNGIKIEL